MKAHLHEELDAVEGGRNGLGGGSGNCSGKKQGGISGNQSDNGERVLQQLIRRRRQFLVRFRLRRREAREFATDAASAGGETKHGVVPERFAG